ncbi:hypothetical protein [Halogeometricum limi]|uniref:Uncharacterized protein n=1 Tax=Halogeometricum limi TaxID=555875 RepID=A0A1I6GRT3_9EURY|nr:hypothetical protein [Halogeometricum limi]SFR44890.1 hypothetical protein SAMN04488124_1449 [Halogeometricum limi]
MLTRAQRVVLAGVVLSIPTTYLVYVATGSFPLAGATLLSVGFVVPSGINGYLDGPSEKSSR